jgi:2-dehydropantoate 2-reductase
MSAPIAVLGPGGIGGMLAARTGAICVGTERTVAAIRAGGLRLVHGETTTVTHAAALEHLEIPVALLLVAVKAYDLDDALDRVAPEAVAGAVVLPLLNGLEHVDAIRERFGRVDAVSGSRPVVAAGSIGRVEAFSPEPGLVVQRTPGATVSGASRELDRSALDTALEPLRVPGIEVVVRKDERAVLWEKAARLAVLAAATTGSGLTVGELRADPMWRGRVLAALDDSVAVARADGAALSVADQWAIIGAMPADLTTSTARDAAAGRPTELEAISGSVVRPAKRLGVPVVGLESLVEEARRRAGLAA